MKKLLLVVGLFLIVGCCMGQNKMPYYIMYQKQNDTIYRNLQTVDFIRIDSNEQELFGNESDIIPVTDIDTVCIFRDKFRKYVGEMADWDEVLFSMEQIHLYKENNNGQPLALFSFYVNDSVPEGFFAYTKFDEEGRPYYSNLNDECVMIVTDVYGELFNAVIINNDMTSCSIDSVAIVGGNNSIYELRDWQDLSPAQRANATWGSYMGGLNMAMGGVTMLYGCSMLIPGVNVAVGMTIALAGAATFISGALLTTTAMDQMLSDGTHTEGFQESSVLFGAVGGVLGAAVAGNAISAAANLAYGALTGGIDVAGDMLLSQENEALQAAYNRAQQIRSMRLTATGRAALLDMETNSVRLYGYVDEKLNPNDRFGIMVAKDPDALTVEDCQLLSTAHATGEFYCDFSGLEPCVGYYYRSYYYASELEGFDTISPWIVSSAKSFGMPGCVTLYPDFNGENSYTMNGRFQDIANQVTHKVGFCYSSNNVEPTVDDVVIEQTISECGEFSAHFNLQADYVYYRAYGYVDDQVVYGETRMITDERYVLEKLYADTHGENWIHNDNWCTGEDLKNWYGINTDFYDFVHEIRLDNNNLNGNISIVGLPYLGDISVNGNQINSIFIGSCPNLDLGYGFRGLEGISLRKLHFDNCFYQLGQHFINNVTIDTIVFTNMRDMGRIFFEDDVVSDVIMFKNSKLDGQGAWVYGNVGMLYIENCSMKEGGIGGGRLQHLYVKNSTIGTWAVHAQYITLVNTRVVDVGWPGKTVYVSYLSGTPEYVWERVYCLAYPYDCPSCPDHCDK